MPAQVPDSQLLVEKIVKLQREMARRQEKVDFMEEHISTMVEEMKKKNRLIQHFMLMQESGMLSSEDMEDNKVQKIILTGKKIFFTFYKFLNIPNCNMQPAVMRKVHDESKEVKKITKLGFTLFLVQNLFH